MKSVKDMELYNKYKESGSVKDRTKLLKALQGTLWTKHKMLAGSLPDSALKAEIAIHAIKGIDTYDPSKGTKLNTHVFNYIAQASRLNYTYQNTVRMSEDKQQGKFKFYDKAFKDLSSELNREPTNMELSTRLGWSEKEVVDMRDNLFQDSIESKLSYGLEASKFSDDKTKLEYIKSKLDPIELTLFNDKTSGMNQVDLVKKHGLDTNKLNYTQRKLKDKVQMLLEKYNA